MRKRRTIDDLKFEYIGKTFNWLTILDVVPGKWHPECICRCICGKEKRIVLDRVIKGVTKSCGCYSSSEEAKEKQRVYWATHPEKLKERASNYSNWCKENPDKVKDKKKKQIKYFKEHPDEYKAIGEKHSQYYKDNPEVGKLAGEKYSKWCKDNPDKVRQKTEKQMLWYKSNEAAVNSTHDNIANTFKENRLAVFCKCDLSSLHPDDKILVMSGNVTSKTKVRSVCPVCGKYDYHRVGAIINYNNCTVNNLLCYKCHWLNLASKAEQEIADYISTFYTGECVRNTRDVISPLELDLYYPEKKIAIEFNGDYWHDEDHKDVSYHYDKYIKCKELNVILVSVFENDWNKKQPAIKEYLCDLFNGKENQLSFKEEYINNNYPSPKHYVCGQYKHHYYTHHNKKVYTCGYSKIIAIKVM